MIVDLIVPVQPESNRPPWPAEGFAISLASLFGAHVTGIVPSFGHAISGMVRAEIPAELIEEFQRRSDEAARTALTAFEKRANDAGVMHQDLALRCGPAEFADAFARKARSADLAIVPQPEAGLWERELVEAALFESGRPALVVPYIHRGDARLDRVLVAWDGSKEAGRAVHEALPLVRRAKEVEVLTIYTEKHRSDDLIPGTDLATHLSRHGLQVTAKALDGEDIGVANVLLSHAADTAVDLIVMGGYAHSRLRHLVFGGATSGILKSMTAPVLMAH
jgi:nucleotide-binding universal stress UspA family protein